MLRLFKAAILGICILVFVAIGIFKFFEPHTVGASINSHSPASGLLTPTPTERITDQKHTTDNAPAGKQGNRRSVQPVPTATQQPATSNAFADGPYTVKGNAIIGADGKRYLFHGVGRDSLEYNCWGDGHFDAQELAYMGSGSGKYAVTYWGANTVRLPLSEGIWLNGQSSQGCSAAQYQALIKQVVNSLTTLKLNVILDLQWSDAGGQSLQAGGPWALPDADSVIFWQQLATIYKSYPNVLFELFNEPHPGTWACWLSGCVTSDTAYSQDCNCNKSLTYNSVGMQALVNAVRGTGATNLVLVAGMDWGYDLSQITKFPIAGTNVVYDTHPYPYTEKLPNTWNAAFGTISKTHPVISAESGQYDCGTGYMSQLLAYFDAHQISWSAWAWVVQGSQCGYPLLIRDYRGTPTAGMGQLIYQHLQSYLK
ncbi:MAG TPA: cellulase family glycosylhydrolase [Ktedonobacteraceae bacterium]|nr:cellulase family glycosylhydrolase [Ktedonobacteraceae bacterium]